METIDKKILKIHNYIYANDGLNNSETLNEFLKIFYCKILDEKQENLLEKEDNGKKILKIVNNLFNECKEILKNIFEKKEKIELKDSTIIYVIKELKEIKFNELNADVKGQILQKIIDKSYRESRGQFFTPLPVVDFIVKMIDPKKGEIGCDPASGTGGFLFTALEHISKSKKINEEDLNNVYFYDISKGLIKLISMRMMFEFGDAKANFEVRDSIEKDYTKSFDYVLTNPPFGTQGKIQDKKILEKYQLGHAEDGKLLKSQIPDILFVEKVIKILKEGGRAAIILPDGDLENPTQSYFRRYLINTVKIDAIISLPSGTFIPYGTGVKSSIIFLTKLPKKELQEEINKNYKIFFGKITKLGYSFSKHSKELIDKEGKVDQDYIEVLNSYKNKIYNKKNYIIGINRIIKENYLLSSTYYNPIYIENINKIEKSHHAKLKDLVEIRTNKCKIENEKKYNYIEISDVSSYTNEIINSEEISGEELPSRASYNIYENDIIVATAGGAIGTTKQAKAIVTKEYEGSICTNRFYSIKMQKNFTILSN